MKLIITLLSLALVTFVAVGCSDDSSTTVVDTAPPAVPDGLSIAYVGGAVTVAWEANVVDADFLGFRVVRYHLGQGTVLVDQPNPEPTLTDESAPLGYNEYRVTAVDRAGNESAYATIGVTIPDVHVDATPEA